MVYEELAEVGESDRQASVLAEEERFGEAAELFLVTPFTGLSVAPRAGW
ncbi:hypothetical protein ACUXZZ_43750 [Streptomyces graminifolii]